MPKKSASPTIRDLETAVARAEGRFAALVDRTRYGVYRSSRAGRFLEANAALVTMLGYDSPDDLLDLEIARDVYVDAAERERLIRLPSGPEFPAWVETRWKRRDGALVNVRLAVRAETDRSGAVVGYDGIVEDITERQRHDELMRRSERMASLGTTLAGVAHELNNPLAAIMGFTQLLLKKSWSAEDHAALETINHEAIRSATIVKDLLALARRPGAERRTSVDVNDVVGYILRTRRYALDTAGVTTTLELDPALPMVSGDRAQLEQVMLNLINNAEQALRSGEDSRAMSRAGGRIRIVTRSDNGVVVIEIEDDGPGIPEDVRTQIWDPFWTTKDDGTGLGLTVVHGIIADHAGTITLEPILPTGTRFVIRLPLAEQPATAPPLGHASRPLDVLVVDPGASDLMFVERFLTSRGHAVVNAASGELAVRLARQTSFDAVVCDARLAVRDGSSVATALRATRGCAGARFVLSDDRASDESVTPAIGGAIGGARMIARPYDVEELRRLIEGD
jgi:PAS domain S-box-containing protein